MNLSLAASRVRSAVVAAALQATVIGAAVTAGTVHAQVTQLPPGLEGLMRGPAGAAGGAPIIMPPGAGGARGVGCERLDGMARGGPGGMDVQQLRELMRCPSAQPGAQEKTAPARKQVEVSFCGMLRQSLESADSSSGAWLGPIPVHAATSMLDSCRESVTPAETKAWGGLVRFGEGRYAESAEALREAMLATRGRYPNPVNWAAFVLVGEPD